MFEVVEICNGFKTKTIKVGNELKCSKNKLDVLVALGYIVFKRWTK